MSRCSGQMVSLMQNPQCLVRFELITSNCQSLKEVVPFDRKRQVGQIEESLVIWVEEMRPLEDAGRNGWTARFLHHDGSCRPRATADWEDRLIVRSAVTAPDSWLSTIRHATPT
ncbi:hypothetical protein TNCV_224901 [Trichonephila clavipes]|nr:hypothetical protein TNCV_224901 [Trichonephila clavipes]